MFNFKVTIAILFVIGFSFVVLNPAYGFFIPKTHLEMYLENDLILYGEILNAREIPITYAPQTEYSISILQQVKGQINSTEIKSIGLGSVNSTLQIDGQTIFSKGDKALLLLNKQDTDNWVISPHTLSIVSLEPNSQFILPPLKLYNEGVPISEIHCKTHLKFAIKSSNSNPICLTSQSFEKLLLRGWIK